ncbi:triose-phosphate isomerase [Microaceticoccus formicicus]|uniref:triose-phosphate isomerase n=1 Tax=Microaceticoccus formicicus TaxID=3118105 RepID=UPI003CD05134|nr:triose-phosphate isomerase [Peptoniphilaceae bacterium AMB_02]
MRKPLIAGNWKMNFVTSEAVEFTKALVSNKFNDDVEKLICVPSVHLSELSKLLKGTDIKLGAQNMYFEESGAFTGEVSPTMLQDLKVDYVIIGHSERREIFKEDDEMINKKVISALAHSITPILCCGETLEEREKGVQEEKVKTQLIEDFKGISAEDAAKVVIAYEPIWAIGTGKTASTEDALQMIVFIRKMISELYNSETAESIRILYGGSVKPDNIREFMETGEIDGGLVGGASLKADSFAALVNY